MHVISAREFLWRPMIMECWREKGVEYRVDDNMLVDLVVDGRPFIIASEYKATSVICTICVPPGMSPIIMTRLNPRCSVLPCPDYHLLLAITPTAVPSPEPTLNPEKLQWMTWSTDPIPYPLACKLYYACPTIDHFIGGSALEEEVEEEMRAAWQTVREFLDGDHYIVN